MLAGCTNDHNCQILPLAPTDFSIQYLKNRGMCGDAAIVLFIFYALKNLPLGGIDVQNLLSSQPTYCLFPIANEYGSCQFFFIKSLQDISKRQKISARFILQVQ